MIQSNWRQSQKLTLLLFLHIFFFLSISLNSPNAFAASVKLSWDEPTTNEDSTPLNDLAGYKVYYGTASGIYSRSIKVGNVTTYTVANLIEGFVYYFAVTAYDKVGFESDYSNEAIKDTHRYNLTVNKSGTGTGTVISSPKGINCGSDCSEAYYIGEIVTLTAKPNTGSIFTNWEEGGCAGDGQCILTINAPTVVTANFDKSDIIPPTGSITINNDTPYAKSRRVKLNLSATDPSGVTQMCISNDTTCTSWVRYKQRKSWILLAEDGEKTVYAWFKDRLDNISTTYSDFITLDTTAPFAPLGSLSATSGENQVSLDWSNFSDPDPASGIASYTLVYSTSKAPTSCKSKKRVIFSGTTTSFVHTELDARKTYYYRLCATDNAGNTGGATASAEPIDTTPPAGSIMINSDMSSTRSRRVTLNLSATDPSGVVQMCISNENTCTSWVRYKQRKSWTLLAGDGEKTVSVLFKDGVGNISTTYSDSITLDSTTP